MGEIIKIDAAEIEKNVQAENDLIEITNGILYDCLLSEYRRLHIFHENRLSCMG